MSRIWKLGSLMLVIGALATQAAADDADRNPPTAGRKGTITAWNETGDVVIAHKLCYKSKGVWDYVACGSVFRDQLKAEICGVRGPGTYKYLYQVADGRKSPSTMYCKK